MRRAAAPSPSVRMRKSSRSSWRCAGWAATTAVAGLLAGLVWMRIDLKTMPSIEHYSWSGWYQPVVPGAYYLGAIVVLVWASRELFWVAARLFARPIAMTLLLEEDRLREL